MMDKRKSQHDVNMTFLVGQFSIKKNGGCLVRKTSTSWMVFFLWENIIHIQRKLGHISSIMISKQDPTWNNTILMEKKIVTNSTL